MPTPSRKLQCALALLAVILASWGSPGAIMSTPSPARAAPPQPAPPTFDPAMQGYSYTDVRRERAGHAPAGAFVFTPVGPAGQKAHVAVLPVIVFIHGFLAVDPKVYQGWIDHLVRRGAVVIYPDYQSSNLLAGDQRQYGANLAQGVHQALERLASRHDLRVEADRVAMIGHSLGGVLAMNYALTAGAAGLPPASSLMIVAPGGCRTCGGLLRGFGVDLPSNGQVPAGLRALVIVGQDDAVVGDHDARSIWRRLSVLPASQRAYIEFVSDRHGQPPLLADHLMAQTSGSGAALNAFDWNGLWPLFDRLVACDTAHPGCSAPVGEVRIALGSWSDGHPVTAPVVIANPG